MSTPGDQSPVRDGWSEFLRRIFAGAAISIGVALPLVVLYFSANILLTVFAGLLLALFLQTLSSFVERRLSIGHGNALAGVVLLLIAITIGVSSLAGTRFAEQLDQMTRELPAALADFSRWLHQYEWGRQISGQIPSPEVLLDGDEPFWITRFFSITFSVAAGFVLLVFIGLYVAAEPEKYRRGVLHLVPLDKRQRTSEVLSVVAMALRWWLLGQFFSMIYLAVTVTALLYLAEVPLALLLGLVVGVLTFIPYLGPIIGFVPVALLSLAQDLATGAIVILVYILIQSSEGYFITPMIQRRVVALPPALTLSTQFLFGALFGAMGVVLATPLLVAVMVTVQQVYVDWLGDRDFTSGEDAGRY